MKILIKGAGDLATGIGCRLYRCGFEVLMTEIPVPTTVRRTVAFSRAVYEKTAVVEEIAAVFCEGWEQVLQVLSSTGVPVVTMPHELVREMWKPDVVVDAILAKENLGTAISDAKTVIGVGPGFTAGVDCHCVVETKRGHDLGRCIWSGGAIPNTGVPGLIGGYGRERIIRAACDGVFKGVVSIGDLVKTGDLVAYSGEQPIYANVGGVVRGLLQDGVQVVKGMKSGDVDPRGVVEYCNTISDKATAIGGGVVEGILSIQKKGLKI